ncbi:hypothetical protein MAPG_11577 [Magnaporthiopsis poae ATCC 64411]|uniref:Molybdenum cofactor biosynthesis protein F n=1 Tax=Magnaporthiopsis poae (strain ATCC 64411 / 73-15) TaxID=644358 RepID=A0A0C4EFM5_MAGP6|nr:hypothetical protein MAPG_11577 [Magnaporthiopsis poae ATCC 64411]
MAQNDTITTGYVPQDQWPTLGAMAEGFGEHLMDSSAHLAGKTIEHTFNNGWRIKHEFDAAKLKWTMLEGEGAGESGYAEYKAYEVRGGFFMVDFYKADHEELITLLLDLPSGRLKVAASGFADNKNGERRTWTMFLDATKAGDRAVASFDPTTELVGKHVLYRYTPRDAYQHFYVSPGTLMWHCVAGTEKDVADAEQAKIFKLSDRLYLLFWTETVMPVESVVVVDLDQMRSTGRFLCWDPKPQSMVHVRFGSQATVLGDVDVGAELAKPLRSKI